MSQKTLREQIREVHAKYFNKEFHEYRQDIIPAMLNDLAEKFFDIIEIKDIMDWAGELVSLNGITWQEWQIVKRGRELSRTMNLREFTPGVEV